MSREWHENGQIASVTEYKFSEINGKVERWHENGQKSFEGNYKQNVEEGRFFEWYESGQIKLETGFLKGKLHLREYW